MRAIAIAGMCVLASVVGLALPGSAWAGVQKVAATGDAAPSYTGGTFGWMSGSPWLNESGQVAFYCDVTTGGMPGGNGGIFLYDFTGGGQVLLRNNDPAPGGGTFLFGAPGSLYVLNDAGQVAFGANLMPSGSGIFRADGMSIAPLIRQGDPAPGTGGGTIGMLDTMSALQWNAAGQTAVRAQIMGGTTVTAIYRADGTALTLLAYDGQAAPGGGTFSMPGTPSIAVGGNVAFISGLMGMPPGQGSGLFIHDDGTLNLLAREGDTAPGTGGATFMPFMAGPTSNIAIGGHDKVAALVNLNSSPPGPNQGIFLWSGGAASPVALQQQAAPEGNGALDMLFALVINDGGQVAFSARLAGSADPPQDDQGIYRATGGTLLNIVRKGSASPDGNGKFYMLGWLPVISGTGLVAFEADLTMTAGAGTDDHGIFISDGIDIIKVAREGDVLPGTSSAATQVSFTPGAPLGWITNDVINAYGQVAFGAGWSPMGGPASGIFLFTPELYWRSAASGPWDTNANWTLGLAPAYVHPVIIDPATNLTVTGPAGAVTVDSLRVAAHGGGAGVLNLSAGGSLTVNKDITVDANGTLRLTNGSLQTNKLWLNTGGTYDGAGGTLDVGTIYQNGGTVTGTLRNAHQFTYSSGTFAGRLLNQGVVTFFNSSAFTAGNGMRNEVQFYLYSGQTLTLNGEGLDNQSQFNFSGGTLTGNGPLINNGYMGSFSDFMTGWGCQPIRIAGSGGFVNNMFFSNYGNGIGVDVFLTNTGANVNNGIMDLSGCTLHLDGGAALTNHGGMGLDTAAVAGAGALTNAVDGTLGGAGIISAPFSNAGQVTVTDGVLRIQQAFVNSGTIDLAATASNLQGGVITNTGSLQGHGHLSNDVQNSGIIEPVGGVLLLSGAFTNNSAGRVNVAAGAKARFTAAPGPNSGIISLEGGSVEFTQALTNAAGGLISGRGTLSVGGTGLANNGSIGLSGGFTDVYGKFTNNTGGKVVISGGSATTFYDDVVLNSGGTFRVSDFCSATFFGSLSGAISIPGNGVVYEEGDLRPGFSPAAILFGGTLVLGSASSTEIELGGTTPGAEYDTVTIASKLTMSGTLNVVLIDDFVPAHNDAFQILTYGSKSGAFSAINGLNPAPRLTLVPTTTATSMTLTAVQDGSGEWQSPANHNASVGANWTGGLPNDVGDVATLGSIVPTTKDVSVDVPTVLGGMVFDDTNNYAVAGPAALTLQNTGLTHATVTVARSGTGAGHNVSANVTLASPLDVSVADAAAVAFSGSLNNAAANAITKTGLGTATFSGPQTHGAGASLAVSEGTANLNSDAGAGGSNLSISTTGNAFLNFGATQHLAALSLGGASTATVTEGGDKTLLTKSFLIAGGATPTATLDLTNNSLLVDYTGAANPADTIKSYLASGCNGGSWDGKGIMSSNAAGLYPTAVGYLDNYNDGAGDGSETVLIKYTFAADGDMDGVVTVAGDFSGFLDGLNGVGTSWYYGDYDYDGVVTVAGDFSLFLDALNMQDGITLGEVNTMISMLNADTGINPGDVGGMISKLEAVPEPATLALLAAGAVTMVLRRRK